MLLVIAIALGLCLVAGSVTVTWAMTATIAETLANNTGSAPAATRLVTHTDYNESGTLTGATTPPVTVPASFLLTLSTGSATINLAAVTGTNGASVDATGLKLQILRIKNLGANNMTFAEGASNGYALGSSIVVHPGAIVMFYFNDQSPDVASGDRTIDVTGTGSQTAEVTMVFG